MKNNASPLVRALEDAWAELQERHKGLPDVVVVLGTGSIGGTLDHWGTWTEASWSVGGTETGEFKLSGETAAEGAEKVLEVLIHEAAHALNGVRGVQDTSRQGRYHNVNFLNTAVEMGLSVEKDDTYGWAHTTYTPREEDAEMLAKIRTALRLEKPYIKMAVEKEKEAKTSEVCECSCPRKLRLRENTIMEGPVLCGICGDEFLPVQ